MVRTVKDKPVAVWKSLLVIVVAGGGLLWHLLACVESPMAFSPDSKNLAFVTMEPYQEESLLITGTHAYRLMILSEDGKLRVVEETTESLLTAPAYSPDGKYICYVRVPLLAVEKYAELETYLKKKKEQQPPAATFEWPTLSGRRAQIKDLTLPPTNQWAEWVELQKEKGIHVPAVLVVREAESGMIWSETNFNLILGQDKPGDTLMMEYVMVRPQYSPDGQWVYVCMGSVVSAMNPRTREQKILAAPANLASLSPDGRTIAFAYEQSIGFIQTDGERVTYRRMAEASFSLAGLPWLDNSTIAMLCVKVSDNKVVLQMMRNDGLEAKEIPLPALDKISDADKQKSNVANVQFAIAGNQKHMVVVAGEELLFMHMNGDVLERISFDAKEHIFGQPTFSPDSRRLAIKHITQEPDGYPRVDAIVLFTPEGKELTRVAVPKIDPTTTRPAPVRKQNE